MPIQQRLPPNLINPRLRFQRHWCIGRVINIGSEANPAGFGTYAYPDAVNVDLDLWHSIPNFVQADGAALPFADRSFDTAVLGDVLEHCEDQQAVLREACRVAKTRIVITLPTDETPEREGRGAAHVEHLRGLGLAAIGPGEIDVRHAHTGEHGYNESKVRALVDAVFTSNGFYYFTEDTGSRLPASPAIGCVGTRR